MPLIDYIDGPNRLVYLSIDTINTSVHPMDLYKEMRELRLIDENLRKFDVFMVGEGNISKGGGKYTERYVVLISGTRIIPFNAPHTLTITGTIITDSGLEGVDCFDRTSLSNQVDINYIPPQVEVITINTGANTPQELAAAVWGANISSFVNIGTFGHFVQKKLLTLTKFIGLK